MLTTALLQQPNSITASAPKVIQILVVAALRQAIV
jgi:hypothetical protein